MGALSYAEKKGRLAGMAANRTCHWHGMLSVGAVAEKHTSLRGRLTKTTLSDSMAYATKLGGANTPAAAAAAAAAAGDPAAGGGSGCGLVFEFNLVQGESGDDFLRLVSDIGSKLMSVLAKAEGEEHPLKRWFAGLKASIGSNPNGDTVMQVAVLSTKDIVSTWREGTVNPNPNRTVAHC